MLEPGQVHGPTSLTGSGEQAIASTPSSVSFPNPLSACEEGAGGEVNAAHQPLPAIACLGRWFRVRGVVFDFYDTLVYVDETKPRQARREMLAALGVPEETFAPVWRKGRDRRMSGHCGDLARQIGETLAAIGVEAPPARLQEFAAKDIAALLESVGVYPNTRRVLAELRRRGYRLALLSNCSYTGEIVLDHLSFPTLFDAVVLSHLLGVLKPDPAIYREARCRLGLEPTECAFVGDGAFGELDAAHRLGMLAVRITQERQSIDYGSSNHADHDISDVAQLLDLLPDLTKQGQKE